MILLQVELATGRTAMYGFSRGMTNVPLPPEWANAYPCGCYAGQLSGLFMAAFMNPAKFPYPGVNDMKRGLKVLERTIGLLAGLTVDGGIAINMLGLPKLVDALGGLDINVPSRLVDPNYPKTDGTGSTVIDIPAGQQRMDGQTALAYVRSRHSDSDSARMQRQQAVLTALRAEFRPCAILPQLPAVLEALGQTVWTDMPQETAPQLAAIAARANPAMGSTLFTTQNGYATAVTAAEVDKIKNAVAHGLDRLPSSGNGGGGGSPSC